MNTFKPLQQKAYEYLKELIFSDSLSYSQVYSETKVAKELGISRTPMRDAIHRLAQERYIDIIPSKGFCLHQMDRQDIQETFQVRSAIEGYCTYLIAGDYRSPKAQNLFKRLEALLDTQKEILNTSQSIPDFVKLDNQFHLEIVGYSENHTLIELFQSYLYQIRRLAFLSLAHKRRMQDTLWKHTQILEHMKYGNTSQIYRITMLHMEKPKGINLDDLDN